MNEFANEQLLNPKLMIQKGQAFQFKFLQSKWLIHSLALFLVCMPSLFSIPLWQSKNQLIEFQAASRLPNLLQTMSTTEISDALDIIFYRTIFINFISIVIYLLNILYWIPAYFYQHKWQTYASIIFLCVLFFGASSFIISYWVAGKILPPTPPFVPPLGFNSWIFLPISILPVAAIFALSTSIEVSQEWARQDKSRQEAENDKLHSELEFLKFQINPHFLFNTLNNIYSLASDKSDTTETAILKLSNLLRYAIYETNVEKISLGREIEQIENYLELQKLRLSAKKNIVIDFQLGDNLTNYQIAPMLLLPFVENAFKHGISYLQDSKIVISLAKVGNDLIFKVLNQKPVQVSPLKDEYSGIGLSNVKRRLDLIYPQKSQLKVQETDTSFAITLTLLNI
jgi:two-component system, LytTR family, sensor kinase